ncbi:glycoside hydrolase [Parachryseolinea silvisoli]|uniref:glycoside hydrolase n=1 Tax=Parachryseolinea silvisoli TaxID=2873601 RepID=UPI002265E21A|nr:glycoside hydrolase [Parachryseolinea silvisoli]MCD9017534.1 xylanase [Parachryseolinea silvisoli]
MQSLFTHFRPWCLALAVLLTTCSRNDSVSVTTDARVVTIHVDDRRQTIHNFGGSDAWACQFVGQWPDDKRQRVADWLFSMDNDANGKPQGIGLSLWRFNIGAGSAAQNNISDEWRRTEGFLNTDGSYTWTRQAGQQWFLEAARQRGVDRFVAFVNSPPVQLTRNGKAYSGNGEQGNILSSRYGDYAVFLATVVKHFRDQGTVFNYLSPFNEPQWEWTGNGQEGSPYTNQEIYDITRKLDSVFIAEGLAAKIQLAEAGKINYLYETADKPTRGNQVDDFFSPTSPRYVGDMKSVDKVISAHSYFTSAPMDQMLSVRKAVDAKIKASSVPLEFWQSEYCVLGEQEEIPGPGKDRGMTTALYVARLVHHDLTVANASAWHWWTSLSAYDYKDGLVYVEKNKADGTVEDTKLLWALGNFSRFVRPGSVRVAVSSDDVAIDNVQGLLVSAYVHDDTHKLVTVIVNYGREDVPLHLSVEGRADVPVIAYITSAGVGDDLKPRPVQDSHEPVTIPGRSVVTLVSTLE